MESTPASPQVKYLYGSFVGRNAAIEQLSAHSHADYWQIEIAISGQFVLRLDDREYEIPAGSAVFVPPCVRHSFDYSSTGISFATAKFKITSSFTDLPVGIVSPGTAESYFLTEIVRLLRELPPDYEKIIKLSDDILSKDISQTRLQTQNPYGDGNSAKRIEEIIFAQA